MPGTGASLSPAPPADRGGSTLADRLLGLAGGAMIVAALVLLVIGGESDGGAGPAVATPVIELVQPEHGAEVRSPRLDLIFRVEGDLTRSPMGWGVDGYHLHLGLDGAELMPAADDVERLPSGLYRWSLPRPEPGLHTARLFWSGADHREVAGSGSRTVQVLVE